jgi:HEAT repeat protein
MIKAIAARRAQRGLMLAGLLWAGPSGAQITDTAAPPPHPAERTPEELSDLRNWVTTVRNPNVEGGMQTRVFDAGRLIAKDWPEAAQAVLQLLDNTDHSEACIPVCRAMAQTAPRPAFKEALFKLLADSSEAVRREAALALAQDSGLATELSALAADAAAPHAARGAALQALGHLTDNFVAMQHLIALLDARDEAIEQPLFDALQMASAAADGPKSPPEWKIWWQDRQSLTREQWLERTVQRLRKQNEKMQDAMVDLARRMAQASEQRYRLTPAGERPRMLQDFLGDRLESVQLLAIDLIQQDIAEGRLPGDELLASLRSALNHAAPRVRRGALTVLGHLRDPQDAVIIVNLLASERSTTVRQAAIEALAKLSSPAAVPVLLEEMSSADRSPSCRMAAARALGILCKRDTVSAELKQRVVVALLDQQQAAHVSPEFNEALLAAMASIADPALAPVLVSHLGNNKASVRRDCIAGLTEIGSRRHLTNMLPFLEDADAGVRLKAAQAIGRLGESEELLDILAPRLDPEIEADTQVREAAWESLQTIWSRQELSVRVAWALRLKENAHRQVELLKRLEEQHNGLQPSQRIEVCMALAERSDELGLFANAVKSWDQVLGLLQGPEDAAPRRQAQARRCVSLLGADLHQQGVSCAAELLTEDSSSWPGLRAGLLAQLERLRAGGRRAEMEQLVTQIRSTLDIHDDDDFNTRLSALLEPEPEIGPALPPGPDPQN